MLHYINYGIMAGQKYMFLVINDWVHLKQQKTMFNK